MKFYTYSSVSVQRTILDGRAIVLNSLIETCLQMRQRRYHPADP